MRVWWIMDIDTFEDKERFITQVVEKYEGMIRGLAYSYLQDSELVKDVSQEVFLTCFKQVHTLRGDSIKPWIFRITINKCLDILRSSTNKHRLNTYPLIEDLSSTEKTPESIVLKRIKFNRVLSGLNELPLKYQEVIILFYFEDLSIKEISLELELNSDTVKTRLFRGRKLLKNKIGDVYTVDF